MANNQLLILTLTSEADEIKSKMLKTTNVNKLKDLAQKLESINNNLSFYQEHSDVVVTLSSVKPIYESKYNSVEEMAWIEAYNKEAEQSRGANAFDPIPPNWACTLRCKIDILGANIAKAAGVVRLGMITQWQELAERYNYIYGRTYDLDFVNFEEYLGL
jgi:hypothetical protein